MIPVPDDIRAAIEGVPAVGVLDQAFVLLTVAPAGSIDVCLLSRTELRTTTSSVRLVVASSKGRRNLGLSGQATLVVIACDAAHYLGLEALRTVADEEALAVEFAVVGLLHDDLGVEMHPILFRVDERLRVEERWDHTAALLDQLEHEGAPS